MRKVSTADLVDKGMDLSVSSEKGPVANSMFSVLSFLDPQLG